MPLLLDTPRSNDRTAPAGVATIEIALLNNYGDAGLKGGERQFVETLSQAAGPDAVRLRFFSLPGIVRGPEAQARIDATYTPYADLMQSRVDGLIVTGCEPRAARLPQEPVWPAMTEAIDWAEHNTRSTIFSCLAAHAAVLHLDGIERRPLARKCAGVFGVKKVAAHPLLDGLRAPLVVPHSRWNGLDADALTGAGYDILTSSPDVGADLFVKQWRSLFVYQQGHPEYDEGALRGEYRRDVLRFVAGLTTNYPDIPRDYFSTAVEAELRAFETAVRRDTATAPPVARNPRAGRPRRWPRAFAVGLLRNWLGHLRAARCADAA